jgi:hypothetical protein
MKLPHVRQLILEQAKFAVEYVTGGSRFLHLSIRMLYPMVKNPKYIQFTLERETKSAWRGAERTKIRRRTNNSKSSPQSHATLLHHCVRYGEQETMALLWIATNAAATALGNRTPLEIRELERATRKVTHNLCQADAIEVFVV